ncbi:nucleotidyltransferase domain-containing protein [Patescibacteria group bacterium]|nr:nucleotidyltransferase domain-containing protein [Patescibacteria group bacterium]MBU1016239.1 nucleotidyltransferase domain-containing protein [Patescibacteria group bacterium]
MIKINSKIERDLLTYFFLHVTSEHHLHEIARIIGADPGNLDKKLKALTKQGLFQVKKRGNQSLYSLNPSFFLFNEYKGIVNKTYGIEHQIKQALQKVPGIKKAFIFGSYASGKFDEYSDIDLLVVGEQDGLELSKAISDVERKAGREINIVEIDSKEFAKPKKPFINQILTEKMIELPL